MEQFIAQNSWVIYLAIAWTLPWKGWALWRAAKLHHRWWFIALLVVNTLGALEILYLFVFSKPKPSTVPAAPTAPAAPTTPGVSSAPDA